MEMTSNKPYIVRAFYDWISDNQLTPYIVVDVTVFGVMVPMAFVNDNQIVLNVAAGAVGSISLGTDEIVFTARFGGKLEHITVPYGAIAAIYAKENGAGTAFEIEHVEEPEEANTLASVDDKNVEKVATVSDKVKSAEDDAPPEKPKGKPSLKVVK